MLVIDSPEGLSKELDARRAAGARVGLVATMGALHAGHLSLVARARGECDVVVLSVFVNPRQFGADEDLDSYPRDPGGDEDKARAAGVDVVFTPSTRDMYPAPQLVSVQVEALADVLEGARRPGHFQGVATVVAKLFHLAGPCRAYFGEKDYQQLVVVRRLVADLMFPVQVVGCPIVREPDGLACSSRNAGLDPAQRRAAPVVHRALVAGSQAVQAGPRDHRAVAAAMAGVVAAEPLASLDYAQVVVEGGLDAAPVMAGDLRLLAAVRIGAVRLIDNLALSA